MAVLRPFRAFRPSEENQSKIPALPYDVMSSAEAREMVEGNPLSFLHVDRAEVDLPEGTDIYSEEVYEKARQNLLNLEQNGDLIQDKKPCLYIYKQTVGSRSQTGIVGCASIDDYINGNIKKHEFTREEKEKDRIRHVDTCNANTGPIFLTYRKNLLLDMITSTWMSENHPVYDFEQDEVKNTVWVIDDDEVIAKIKECFASIDSLYIADGHHRCASAVKVGLKRRENGNYTGEEEFNFFLCVAFPDNELEIMDYNRVVKDLNGYTEEEFIEKVKEKFTVTERTGGPFKSCKPFKRHTFGMYLNKKWYELEAKSEFVDETDPVARLDVSILYDNLLAPILAIGDTRTDKRIDFVGGIRGIGELERRVATDMTVAFSMFPTTVDDLIAIADAGMIMPPKSTWFEPKLLSGLFIHHLS